MFAPFYLLNGSVATNALGHSMYTYDTSWSNSKRDDKLFPSSPTLPLFDFWKIRVLYVSTYAALMNTYQRLSRNL